MLSQNPQCREWTTICLPDRLNENETQDCIGIMRGSLDSPPTLSAYITAIWHPFAANYLVEDI